MHIVDEQSNQYAAAIQAFALSLIGAFGARAPVIAKSQIALAAATHSASGDVWRLVAASVATRMGGAECSRASIR